MFCIVVEQVVVVGATALEIQAPVYAGMTRPILAELEDYTRRHSSIEEEAFDETAYPEAKGHKAEHAVFMGKLADFRKALAGPGRGSSDSRMVGDAGDAGAAAAMLAFLRSWLTRHISFSDKRYRPWLAGRF